jgi:6-phosphofructokinase
MPLCRGKAVIAHGGGPTAVLNASLAGVIESCRGQNAALYGARFGLPGIASGSMANLLEVPPALIQTFLWRPAPP